MSEKARNAGRWAPSMRTETNVTMELRHLFGANPASTEPKLGAMEASSLTRLYHGWRESDQGHGFSELFAGFDGDVVFHG